MKKIQVLNRLVLTSLASLIGLLVAVIAIQYVLLFHVSNDELVYTQTIIIVLTVLVIIALMYWLIYPLYSRFKDVFIGLIDSEESAKKMTQEVNKLYNELGKSYQDLEAVNLVPTDPTLLLKMDIHGRVLFVSEKLKQTLCIEDSPFNDNFHDWLESQNLSKDFVSDLRTIMIQNKAWTGELNITDEYGDLLWLDLYIQPVFGQEQDMPIYMIMGRDITDIKEAKQRSREINHETIAKRVKEQQYRSVLILEGQEEERKRIAAEIHDGIGQMLTGLKLNLEGITPSSSAHMKKRIRDTKDLMKSVIKEVRRVSFNLTPSSLVDFGLAPAMKKISQEMSSLTSTTVEFENLTGFINRLDKNVETNLYRIVQEAVNNGIKYAHAEKILISFEHNPAQLQVTIADNGKGFEMHKLEKIGHFGASGHGIFNMKERAAFIEGVFDIKTELKIGTTITITLPLN